MENAPEASFINELLGQRDRGRAAIIIPNHVRHARFLDGLDHLQALNPIQGQRLFAQYSFAGLCGRNRDLFVHIVGAGDVNERDIVARDELAPIRFVRFVAPFFGKGLDLGLVAGANRFENGPVFEVEEVVDLAEGV